jgi:hypothetical protein
MEVSDVAKLKAMEDENVRLKRLLADTMLEKMGASQTATTGANAKVN